MNVGVSEYFVPEVRRESGTVVLRVQGFCVQLCSQSPTAAYECSTRSTGFLYRLQYEFLCTFSV